LRRREACSRSAGTSLELSPPAAAYGIWALADGIVCVELALSVARLRGQDSYVLVSQEVADLDPLEDKSYQWAEGKEKGPEDSRTQAYLAHRPGPPNSVRPATGPAHRLRPSTLVVHSSVASSNRGDRSPIGGRDARPGQDRGLLCLGRDWNGAMSAQVWKCSDCGVKVTFDRAASVKSPAPSRARSKPDHWVADERGWHCLRCQREAVLGQPTVEGAGTRVAQRRRALVRFELLREPGATDAEVARRAKCTSAQVAPVRRDLVYGGHLRSQAPADA
jgi:hypothetical protein